MLLLVHFPQNSRLFSTRCSMAQTTHNPLKTRYKIKQTLKNLVVHPPAHPLFAEGAGIG